MSEKQVSATGDDGHGAFLPIGSIVMWGGEKNKVPNGWLVCDGGTYTRKQYPLLADMIGANFGQPENPNADFYVPDLRGRFVRGVDEGLGRDPDRDAREDMRSKKVVGGKLVRCKTMTFAVIPIRMSTHWVQRTPISTSTAEIIGDLGHTIQARQEAKKPARSMLICFS